MKIWKSLRFVPFLPVHWTIPIRHDNLTSVGLLFPPVSTRDTRSGSKNGQILDFLRSVLVWLGEPECTEIWSGKVTDLSHLGPIWPTLKPNQTSLVSTYLLSSILPYTELPTPREKKEEYFFFNKKKCLQRVSCDQKVCATCTLVAADLRVSFDSSEG